jgi:hypothetical protein
LRGWICLGDGASSIVLCVLRVSRSGGSGSNVDIRNISTEALRPKLKTGGVIAKLLASIYTINGIVACRIVPDHIREGGQDLLRILVRWYVVPVSRSAFKAIIMFD